MKNRVFLAGCIFAIIIFSCNHNMSGDYSGERRGKIDRSQRTVIDSQEYVDFTSEKYNALTHKREDILGSLSGRAYRNGDSYIKFNAGEGTVEIRTDRGYFNGRDNIQMYGKFGIEVMAASSDCLYIRRHPGMEGMLLAGNEALKNEQIPDLSVCIPLYGYSRNRIEVSSVMNGYIAMPSGTYWFK